MKTALTKTFATTCALFLLFPLTGSAAALNTDIVFHELALPASQRKNADKSFNLPFDTYVIGVEKANSSQIGSVRECESNRQDGRCININSAYYANNEPLRQDIRSKYSKQHRPTFVSHVARFSKDTASTPCFLYNIYDQSTPCDGKTTELPSKQQFVSNSWDVLLGLESDISKYIQRSKPTHFIVYFMGWNTPQWKAIKNYRDLFSSLTTAAKEGAVQFRPLFLGITWPSTGSPIISASDYGIKAKDADEVGLIWGNIVINRVLSNLKAQYGIPIVVVGHSFGARASSRAVFSAPLVLEAGASKITDLLLGFQGAYTYQRYLPGAGTEGAPYGNFPKVVGKVVLTSSRFDTAVTQLGHKNYFVGSSSVFDITKRKEYMAYFEHSETGPDGQLGKASCNPSKVEMVDASSVINKNQPNTGGGAHSFIFGPEIGRLTLQLISACTIPAGMTGK